MLRDQLVAGVEELLRRGRLVADVRHHQGHELRLQLRAPRLLARLVALNLRFAHLVERKGGYRDERDRRRRGTDHRTTIAAHELLHAVRQQFRARRNGFALQIALQVIRQRGGGAITFARQFPQRFETIASRSPRSALRSAAGAASDRRGGSSSSAALMRSARVVLSVPRAAARSERKMRTPI